MRQHAGVFGSLLVVAAIVSGLALGVLALIDRAATAGVRDELAARTGEDGALRVSLLLTTDPESADAAVRESVADAFQRDGRDIPLTVHHEVRSAVSVPFEVRGEVADEQAPDHVVVASIPDLEAAAELVAGAGPPATTRRRCRRMPPPPSALASAIASRSAVASSPSSAPGV
jgi:hypothetical protein